MSHNIGGLYPDGKSIGFKLRVDVDKFAKWSAAERSMERSLLVAIAVEPWWSEHSDEPRSPYKTSGA